MHVWILPTIQVILCENYVQIFSLWKCFELLDLVNQKIKMASLSQMSWYAPKPLENSTINSLRLNLGKLILTITVVAIIIIPLLLAFTELSKLNGELSKIKSELSSAFMELSKYRLTISNHRCTWACFLLEIFKK